MQQNNSSTKQKNKIKRYKFTEATLNTIYNKTIHTKKFQNSKERVIILD